MVNGISLAECDKNRFKKHLGIVTQDTQLFAGTIKENLLFVNPEASDADCLKVLEQASLSDFIAQQTQ